MPDEMNVEQRKKDIDETTNKVITLAGDITNSSETMLPGPLKFALDHLLKFLNMMIHKLKSAIEWYDREKVFKKFGGTAIVKEFLDKTEEIIEQVKEMNSKGIANNKSLDSLTDSFVKTIDTMFAKECITIDDLNKNSVFSKQLKEIKENIYDETNKKFKEMKDKGLLPERYYEKDNELYIVSQDPLNETLKISKVTYLKDESENANVRIELDEELDITEEELEKDYVPFIPEEPKTFNSQNDPFKNAVITFGLVRGKALNDAVHEELERIHNNKYSVRLNQAAESVQQSDGYDFTYDKEKHILKMKNENGLFQFEKKDNEIQAFFFDKTEDWNGVGKGLLVGDWKADKEGHVNVSMQTLDKKFNFQKCLRSTPVRELMYSFGINKSAMDILIGKGGTQEWKEVKAEERHKVTEIYKSIKDKGANVQLNSEDNGKMGIGISSMKKNNKEYTLFLSFDENGNPENIFRQKSSVSGNKAMEKIFTIEDNTFKPTLNLSREYSNAGFRYCINVLNAELAEKGIEPITLGKKDVNHKKTAKGEQNENNNSR